jgi:hypothetical protein
MYFLNLVRFVPLILYRDLEWISSQIDLSRILLPRSFHVRVKNIMYGQN